MARRVSSPRGRESKVGSIGALSTEVSEEETVVVVMCS
jgi:hypothetical protein